MPARFPRKRPDGSFGLELIFESDRPLEHEAISAWLSEWNATNHEWIRQWRGPHHRVVETQVLRLSDAFVRDPYVVRQTADSVTLRLDAVPEAAFWKDWMAKLVGESVSRFPCLTFKEARDAD